MPATAVASENKTCDRDGLEDATGSCLTCGMSLCDDCLIGCAQGDCGAVYCGACGGPLDKDIDLVDETNGGGIHRRCD